MFNSGGGGNTFKQPGGLFGSADANASAGGGRGGREGGEGRRRAFPGSPRLFGMPGADVTTLFGMPPIPALGPTTSSTGSTTESKPPRSGFSFTFTPVSQQAPPPPYGSPTSVLSSAASPPQPIFSKPFTFAASARQQQSADESNGSTNVFGDGLKPAKVAVNPFVSSTPMGTNVFSGGSVGNPFKPKDVSSSSSAATAAGSNIFSTQQPVSTGLENDGTSRPVSSIFAASASFKPLFAASSSSGTPDVTSSTPFAKETALKPFPATASTIPPVKEEGGTPPDTSNIFKLSASLFAQTAIANPVSRIFAGTSGQASSKPTKSIFSRLTPRTTTKVPAIPQVFSKRPTGLPTTEKSDVIFARPAAPTQKLAALPLKRRDLKKSQPVAAEVHLSDDAKGAEAPADANDLLQIVRKRALSDQDRFDILEARDKIMKSKGLHKKSTVLIGTCPDICPEKERYSRLTKNQLRFYEKLNDEINPKAVVKEYSRSSADQDVPLSHELRPAAILKRTMDHIICNVIDRVDNIGSSLSEWYRSVEAGEHPQPFSSFGGRGGTGSSENIGDWFEFVWNTTRAIRKDITQQQLTNLVAVSLVEKCTRFHIMCADRLVEEDSNNFSRKLNDENLTKCLQTLSHMYEDLKHEGVACPNEPEFRSYEVLMNLNDGDVLRSILTLDLWVREAPAVRLSIKVFMALNSNNYVKFFKLVRESTLLQGCILLRYFYQIRRRALETIIRVNCPSSKNDIPFSLTKLSYLLGFEDVQACGLYCRLHGVNYEVNSDTVFLSRGSYFEPDELPEVTRARNLIESKRTVPWSEVVNGGPLEHNPYINYLPHNSFTDDGFLRPEALDASDQVGVTVPMSPEDRALHNLRLQRQRSVDSSANELVTEILEETIWRQAEEVAEETVVFFQKMDCAGLVARELSTQVIEEIIGEVAAEVMREARNAELAKRLEQEFRADAAQEVTNMIVQEQLDEMITDIAKGEIVLVERELKLSQYIEVAKDVVEEMCGNYASQEVKSLANEVLRECKREQLMKLQQLQKRHELRLLRRVFGQWRAVVAKQKRVSNMLQMFPSCPSNLTVGEQNQKLGQLHRGTSSGALGNQQKKTKHLFQALDLGDSLLQKLILEPLDMTEVVAPKLLPKFQGDLSWKCLLCPPALEETSALRPLCEAIKRKFTRDHARSRTDPNLLYCQRTAYRGRNFSVCIRCVDGEVLDEEVAVSEKKRRDYMAGAGAILFIHLQECESDNLAQQRLHKLLSNIYRKPAIPLYILTTATNMQKVLHSLDVECFEQMLSDVDISFIPADIFDVALVHGIARATSVLAEKSPEPSTEGLQVRSIRDYVEDFICSNVLGEFYANLRDRQAKQLSHQQPKALIALFNGAVAHLEHVILNEDLREVSWPIPELSCASDNWSLPSYWNDSLYLDIVVECLQGLLLPIPEEVQDDSWMGQVSQVYKCLDVMKKSYADCSACEAKIRRSLLKAYRCYERRKFFASDSSVVKPYVPWTDIVHAFIDYKISLLPTVDKFSSSQDSIVVAFYQSDLETFQPPKFWKASVGWVPESQATAKLLERSLTAKRRSFEGRQSSEVCLEKIRQELDDSARFEERLLRSAAPTTFSLDISSSVMEEDLLPTSPKSTNISWQNQRVPTISLLSPTLSQMLLASNSSRSTMKIDNRRVSKSPAFNKRKHDTTVDFSPKKPASVDITRQLQRQIEEDLNASYNFEVKLQEALSK